MKKLGALSDRLRASERESGNKIHAKQKTIKNLINFEFTLLYPLKVWKKIVKNIRLIIYEEINLFYFSICFFNLAS